MADRYMTGTFTVEHKATIGAEFKASEVSVGGETVGLQVWDTAGQEMFKCIQGLFYRGADGCILVFDITNHESFLAIAKWRDEFLSQARVDHPLDFPFVLIGNKVDLATERKVRGYINLRY